MNALERAYRVKRLVFGPDGPTAEAIADAIREAEAAMKEQAAELAEEFALIERSKVGKFRCGRLAAAIRALE